MAKAIPAPLSEMNTTPLIDVMLVLLIMFVITIPAATDALQIDLPVNCADCPAPDATKNKVIIDAADIVHWNGTPVNQSQLSLLLSETRRMPVEPELQLEPAARAGYDTTAKTLSTIKASGITKFGFVGNEQYRVFGKKSD